MTSGPVRVSTDALDTSAILRQSIARTDEMRRGNVAYGRTSLEMNHVGLLGEHAVHWYLSGLTPGSRSPLKAITSMETFRFVARSPARLL